MDEFNTGLLFGIGLTAVLLLMSFGACVAPDIDMKGQRKGTCSTMCSMKKLGEGHLEGEGSLCWCQNGGLKKFMDEKDMICP